MKKYLTIVICVAYSPTIYYLLYALYFFLFGSTGEERGWGFMLGLAMVVPCFANGSALVAVLAAVGWIVMKLIEGVKNEH